VKDAQNKISHVQAQSAGDAITPRWMNRTDFALDGPFDTPDKTASEGLFDWPYDFANQRVRHVATRSGVPVGFWRAVGHSHNAFFSECFVDELAAWVGQDPVAFRKDNLKGAPRHLAVLNLVAEKAKWGSALPAGRARGIALHESFGSVVAHVLEVSLLTDGTPKIHSVVSAVDCGVVINPNNAAQQIESAVVFGLTAALYGKVDIQAGVVQQSNFNNYRMLKLAEVPQVTTYFVQSARAPTGLGEPGLPPIAPALANALHVLVGRNKPRLRELPLKLA
jgi:isoquinoline 1-oxidoreductase subunit beta